MLKNVEKFNNEKNEEKKKIFHEHIQKQIDALQNIYWSIPINLAVKHFSDDAKIDLGVKIGVNNNTIILILPI